MASDPQLNEEEEEALSESVSAHLILDDSDDDSDTGQARPPAKELSKKERSRQLLSQMLELQNPMPTSTVIDFLVQDGVCELLIEFITRVPDSNSSEPAEYDEDGIPIIRYATRDEEVTQELVRSYKATMLLTADSPTDSLLTFLKDMAPNMTTALFKVFEPKSQGNLQHGCRVLDRLYRLYPDQVFYVINHSSSTARSYMSSMLEHVQDGAVADLFCNLICRPPDADSKSYHLSPQAKWKFYRAMAEWKVLLVLIQHATGSSYSPSHSVACAEIFMTLLYRLALDDNGEILLQPVGHCLEIYEDLVSVMNDRNADYEKRKGAARAYLSILQRTAEEQLSRPLLGQQFKLPQLVRVTNQLSSLKNIIFPKANHTLPSLCQVLVGQYQQQRELQASASQSGDDSLPLPCSVRHTSYTVVVPFSEFRLSVVDILVQLVEYEKKRSLVKIPPEVWKILMHWVFEYENNNLYQVLFYKLLFIVLRADHEPTLEAIFKRQKLLTLLIENFKKSSSTRGVVVKYANAIRLQASSLPPSAYLPRFLKSHEGWRKFEPELKAATLGAEEKGFGLTVPKPSVRMDAMGQFIPVSSDPAEVEGIELGSDYAKSLGFLDDVAWPVEEDTGPKKAKKKKKKKKKNSISSSEDQVSEDDQDDVEGSEQDDREEGDLSPPTDSAEATEPEGGEEEAAVEGGDSSPSPQKKKKKKKKKKSLSSSETDVLGSDAAMGDEEGEDRDALPSSPSKEGDTKSDEEEEKGEEGESQETSGSPPATITAKRKKKKKKSGKQ